MPVPSYLPTEAGQALGRLTEPEISVQILPSNQVDGADGAWSAVDPEVALSLLASNKNALDATGMDSEALRKRLSTPWTAESALRDCELLNLISLNTAAHRFVADSYGATVKL